MRQLEVWILQSEQFQPRSEGLTSVYRTEDFILSLKREEPLKGSSDFELGVEHSKVN